MSRNAVLMSRNAVMLAAALVMAPASVRAADLVVWWFKGFYEQEDAAVREIIAAFEQESGKQVELVQPTLKEMIDQANAALEVGRPPDFLYSQLSAQWTSQWAYDDRLVEHTSVPWEALPGRMRQIPDGEWQIADRPERLPHSYTLQAVLPAV